MSGLQPQSQDQSASAAYPVMEFDEMEGYLFESLEIIATTPISQYYGPENDQNELDSWPCHAHPNLQSDPLSPTLLAAAPAPSYERWDKKNSFQKVHQRAIEGQQQPQEQQSSYLVSPPTSIHSPGDPVPIYTQLNQYHSNTMPQYPSSESSDSQRKVEDPALKRMRNTAASARFRAKKKRQEQIQQQTARENQEALDKLRNRVAELETENRWLKNLVLDKSEAAKRKDFEVVDGDRKGSEHKDGVGT